MKLHKTCRSWTCQSHACLNGHALLVSRAVTSLLLKIAQDMEKVSTWQRCLTAVLGHLQTQTQVCQVPANPSLLPWTDAAGTTWPDPVDHSAFSNLAVVGLAAAADRCLELSQWPEQTSCCFRKRRLAAGSSDVWPEDQQTHRLRIEHACRASFRIGFYSRNSSLR